MKISILTFGTRGDVQPYIALGLGLQEAGHSVTLGTSKDFADDVAGWGLGFAPFQFSVRKVLDDPDSRAAFVSKRAALRLYRKVAPLMPGLLDDAWAAAREAQLVLFHPKILNALDIAEKLNVPAIAAFYLPALTPTRAFPAPFLPGPITWGGFLNKVSHRLFLRVLTAPYHRLTNRWRMRSLNLPPRPFIGELRARYGSAIPKLYGYSPHIAPTPSDWDSSAHVTGHWFLDSSTSCEPPPGLQEFLGQGSPPVAVGFGSIAGHDPGQTTGLVLEALRLSGQRGVIVTGWGGLCANCRPPETVRVVQSVPYDWLLPQVAAVVHHGGAGSTAEGLRAGKPTVVCPFFGDQPFWGRRVFDLGAGPRPIPQKRLTAAGLAEAITSAVSDVGIRHRAAAIGEKIRAEKGVQRAVEVISALTADRSSGRSLMRSTGV